MQLYSLRFSYSFPRLLNVLSRSRIFQKGKQVRDKSFAKCNTHTACCRATFRALRSLTNSRKFFISTCLLRENVYGATGDTKYVQCAHVSRRRRLASSPLKCRDAAATSQRPLLKRGDKFARVAADRCCSTPASLAGFSKWN